jgi:hypothetical protein
MDEKRVISGSRTNLFSRFAAAIVAVIALVGGAMAVSSTSAAAAGRTDPSMTINASTSTIVGLQIFANVSLSGSSPTGSVTFRLFGPSDPTCSGAIFTSTIAVAGSSLNSDHFTTSQTGTYRWQATYGGDVNNNSYGPTPCATASAAVTVSPTYTGLAVTAAPPSGGTIHATANLGGYRPTGSINFLLTAPGDDFCSNTPVFSSVVPVAGIGTYTSAAYSPTVAGSYKWRAIYSGDPNNYEDGPTACLDQNAAVTVDSVTSPSPGISFNPASVTFATQGVTTASPIQRITVSSTGSAALAVKSIAVAGNNPGDFPTSGDTCTGATVAPGASCTIGVAFSPTATGTRSATVTFADNSPGGPHVVAVSGPANPRPLTTPQVVATASGPVEVGGAIWATAGLSAGSAPTGSVTVRLYGNTTCSGPPIFTSTIAVSSGNGAYRSASYTTTAAGDFRFVATYAGDANNSAVASPCSDPKAKVTVSAPPPPPPPPPAKATFTKPVDGQTNVATTTPFTWTTTTAADGYYLAVGTSRYGTDLVNSGVLAPSQSSFAVPDLPAGPTLYATLLTEINGSWSVFQAVTFTAAVGHATFLAPLNGQAKFNSANPFTWATVAGAQGYYLAVGTSKYGTNLVNSGGLSATRSSFTVNALPKGETLYATILTKVNGAWARFQAVTFVAG